MGIDPTRRNPACEFEPGNIAEPRGRLERQFLKLPLPRRKGKEGERLGSGLQDTEKPPKSQLVFYR